MLRTFLARLGILGVILGVVAIVALVVLWPLVTIWALNTLFALNIAYTFWTWLAMLIVTMTFGKASSVRVKTN